MKTTIDIADNILARCRTLAKEEDTTIKELVEEGLILAIEKHQARPSKKVEPVTFKGNGLSAEFRSLGWSGVRDAVYAGHGA